MDSLIFSINCTMPIFLVMVLGWWLRHRKMLTDEFIEVGNKLVFNVALPVSMYQSVSKTDFSVFSDLKLVAYCITVGLGSFALCWVLGVLFVKERDSVGSFVQGASRGNIAILGIAFIQNMYNGESGAMPMIIAIIVTIYNVVSVILLSIYDKEAKADDRLAFLKKALTNIWRNPLIRGIAIGMIASALRVDLPAVADKTLTSIASLSTPLALVVLGAGFDFSQAKKKIGLTAAASFLKLIGLPMICMPIAVALGYRGITLASLLIMSGASTAVSSYIMAKNMHNDAVLASSVVAVTTFLSSFTLTFWIFLLRFFGYL